MNYKLIGILGTNKILLRVNDVVLRTIPLLTIGELLTISTGVCLY